MFEFKIKKKLGDARLIELTTPHGVIAGPFFQFVATQAAIRGLVFAEDLEKMRVQIVLTNTYHLHLRPGEDVVAEAGGLHDFMQWNGPITTDSGGYQVFSLGTSVKLDKEAVTFRSPLDGSLHRLTPEKAIQIQNKLGADIIMPLDVCTPFKASYEEVAKAVDQTYEWAKRCKVEHERLESKKRVAAAGEPRHRSRPAYNQALYGIVQGGVYADLRERCASHMRDIGFFGYSIGGELREGNEKKLKEVVGMTTPYLPEDVPRYLMGYGQPEDILEAVRVGVDQFDCVLPIRNARHGQLFYDLDEEEVAACLQDPERPIQKEKLYTVIDINKSSFARDFSPLSPDHPVIQKQYTKAYAHHLMRAETPSGMRLTVLHNIYFYVRLMEVIRKVIEKK